MSSKKVIIQTVLFAILGAVLLYFSFDKINISELVAVLKKGDYTVVLPVFLVSLLVYVSRVKRWQILYKAADKDVPANFLFASLASGYLVNFVVPRLGEITRAAVLKKWQNIPMNLSLPTVVFERIIDLLCLLIILVAAFVLEVQLEGSLLNEFTKGVSFVNAQKLYMLAALLPLGIIFYFWIKKREDKLSKWIQEFIGVFSQLIKMPKLGWFI
ncbi:MAG: flippase-like domain-containing protein, partial [Bacteroidia bacterium]|nr:flippase-like domain-containing protein [Bacteroidia bacterium]